MRGIAFDPEAFEDLAWWIERDRKTAPRVVRPIREAQRTPFEGTGMPEPLRHEPRGAWSRRIDRERRLVSGVSDEAIRVIACRNHD